MAEFVTMREWWGDSAPAYVPTGVATLSYLLRSLPDPARMARVDCFMSEGAARSAAPAGCHRLLLRVDGPWHKPPSHAVCAAWQVQDLHHAAAFVESRRQLFTLRQRVLPTFCADWLLAHCDEEGRYLVLGFYGDEEGASRLCREHAAIRQFAASHPASLYTAVDLTGLLCWRIEQIAPAAGSVRLAVGPHA